MRVGFYICLNEELFESNLDVLVNIMESSDIRCPIAHNQISSTVNHLHNPEEVRAKEVSICMKYYLFAVASLVMSPWSC